MIDFSAILSFEWLVAIRPGNRVRKCHMWTNAAKGENGRKGKNRTKADSGELEDRMAMASQIQIDGDATSSEPCRAPVARMW